MQKLAQWLMRGPYSYYSSPTEALVHGGVWGVIVSILFMGIIRWVMS